MTFMDFVRDSVMELLDRPSKSREVVARIKTLPTAQAMVVTAYILDHLKDTGSYNAFLSAVERAVH